MKPPAFSAPCSSFSLRSFTLETKCLRTGSRIATRARRQSPSILHSTRMSVASATSERLADETIMVNASSRTYPIIFKDGGIEDCEIYSDYLVGDKVLIVTNDVVGPLYLGKVQGAIEQLGKTVFTVILPDGEQHKSMDSLRTIWDACINGRLDRKSTIVALGGGVVGDVTGFAAATYVRGISFIQIPTTLLAVVDSAVGGKTAINHPGGKNMIGAFYQPKCVLVDSEVLGTLDDRQVAAGISEVIKYGIIYDWEFFEWCERNIRELCGRNPRIIRYAMRKSCECKAEIVSMDEKESGIRAILNLGHTFGHAIEASMGYGCWLHGEAVAAGMVMACKMSEKMDLISPEVTARVENLLVKASLPIRPPPAVSLEKFMTYMSVDKKVESGKLRLILLRKEGEAFVTADFEENILFDTIMHYHQLYKNSPGTYEHDMFKLPLVPAGDIEE